MAYPFSDFPPLADLSLNDSRRPAARRTTLVRLSNPSQHTLTFPTYQMQRRDLSWSGRHHSRWSVPGWQSTLDFGSDSVPPLHSSTFEPWGPSMPKSTMESLFLPRMSLPDLDCEFCCLYRTTIQSDTVSTSGSFAIRHEFVHLFGSITFTSAVFARGV